MTLYRIDKHGGNAAVSDGGNVISFAGNEASNSSRNEVADRRKLLAELFEQHHRQLVRFLTIRLGSEGEAQEVAQEAYVRLLQPEALKHGGNPQAFLYTTARNIAIDRARRRRRWVASESERQLFEATVSTPERIVSDREQLDRIGKLIEALPPKCRHAFVSYRFHEESYAEIAARMGLTESMVRKYVLRAMSYCAANLERENAP